MSARSRAGWAAVFTGAFIVFGRAVVVVGAGSANVTITLFVAGFGAYVVARARAGAGSGTVAVAVIVTTVITVIAADNAGAFAGFVRSDFVIVVPGLVAFVLFSLSNSAIKQKYHVFSYCFSPR